MYQKIRQNNWLRLGMGVCGALLLAAAINLFIVPQGLYSGGLYGLCQVIRTLLKTKLGLETPFDMAGLLYLLGKQGVFGLGQERILGQHEGGLALGGVEGAGVVHQVGNL